MHAEIAGVLPHHREMLVEGKRIRVFDGYLPNAAEYVAELAKMPFTRTEVARPETAGYKHWVSELRIEALLRQPIMELTHRAARGFAAPGVAYRPYRAYTNVAGYGDMLFTHVDCLPGQRELTALWYLCDRWDLEWGGETMFFDAQGDAAYAVTPKPGRLVVFDGDIVHAGRPPNRICYAPRYTFAIKLEPVSEA
ncbi:2OG-Fe(II) oxygenase [Pseudoxanthomonas wuyuanensis]